MNINFESIKHLDKDRIEYWTARELFPLLGYSTWHAFDDVVNRAIKGALNSGQIQENHFTRLTKMVSLGSNSKREIKDWKLDRYACYLIAQNGDSRIQEIALAQTYFAIQTRKQELSATLASDLKRLQKRKEVSDKNKKLFSTAKLVGVFNFGKFNDAGYKGLYTMPLSEIELKKNIKKGELLDRAGGLELAANLFRITQTEDKLLRENIKGDNEAQMTHFEIGKKVRKAIKDIGGIMPENLKPEKHIKELNKDTKVLKSP